MTRRPMDEHQIHYYQIQTPLRRAYLRCSKRTGLAYVSVRDIKKELKDEIGGTITEERLLTLLVMNAPFYDIKTKTAVPGQKSRGRVRFRNQNVGELMVLPNLPATRDGQREYI